MVPSVVLLLLVGASAAVQAASGSHRPAQQPERRLVPPAEFHSAEVRVEHIPAAAKTDDSSAVDGVLLSAQE
jgi:hypothetical protein